MQHLIERPLPAGSGSSGQDVYDPDELAAHRMRHGVTIEELAKHMGVSPSLVSLYENPKRVKSVQAKQAVAMLNGAIYLAGKRQQVVSKGEELYARIEERKASA